MGPVDWDSAPSETIAEGCLRRTRWDLGSAAGSVALGVKRVRVEPGGQASPVHAHSDEEEMFYVLGGTGLLWQDGAVCEVRPDDAIAYPPGGGPAHTLVGGPEGLDVLAFGERRDSEAAFLPRLGIAWHGDTWTEAGGGEHPFLREAALEPVDVSEVGERPANVVHCDDALPQETRRGATSIVRRDIGRTAGSVRTGMAHIAIAPSAESSPPHCHSAEEELFVVLEGSGVLRLGDDHEHPVARGSVIARPAGTGVAHSFAAGEDGLVLLAYGQRESNDILWYPRSQKLYVKGVRAVFKVERVGYWEGEE